MKYILFLFYVVFTTCHAIRPIRQDVGKLAHFCRNVCSNCDGVGVFENDICLCYVKDHEDECLHSAKSKANIFGVNWLTLKDPEESAKQTRPIRGSFLDPIVANVFERPSAVDEMDLVTFNSLRSNPARLAKRSLDASTMPKMNSIDRSTAPRLETKRRRGKRSPYEKGDSNVYTFAIRPGTGRDVQLRVPYTDDSFDIEHEFHFVADDDDFDCYGQVPYNYYDNRYARSPWFDYIKLDENNPHTLYY